MLKPINGNIIVKKEDNELDNSGFITSVDSNAKFSRGEVIASDSDVIKVGDIAVFAKYALDTAGDSFIIHSSDVFAVEDKK